MNICGITIEIFDNDEEPGLCLAQLLKAEREICIFYGVKDFFDVVLNSIKQLTDI